MPDDEPRTLDVVIGERVRALRLSRGWRLQDLADAVTKTNVNRWTTSKVALVESGDRGVSVPELAGLSLVFQVPARHFFDVDEVVQLPGGYAHLQRLKDAFERSEYGFAAIDKRGDTPKEVDFREAFMAFGQRAGSWVDETDRKAARTLNIPATRVAQMARALWGRSLMDERDIRIGDTDDMSPRSLQAKRGHVTRKLLDELREQLDGEGGE